MSRNVLGQCVAGVLFVCLAAPVEAQQRRRQPGWPCAGSVDPAYVQGAERTGGVVMLFTPAEIAGAAAEMSFSSAHQELVFRAGGQFAQGVYEFTVPLDSTIQSAYFFVSMQCLQGATIIDPSGQELRSDAPGVEHHDFTAIRLLTVPDPAPGVWKLRLTGSGYLSVLVKARTDLRLGGVTFGTQGSPLKREPQRLEVTLSAAASDVAFEFISGQGAAIAPLNLQPHDETENTRSYVGEVTPPAADFRVSATGTDARGFRFLRVQTRLQMAER